MTLLALWLLVAAPATDTLPASPPAQVEYAEVEGVIGPVTAEFITHFLDRAERRHADLAVIGLDTPGGLDESMRIIVKRMLQSRVPVVVYVAPPGARAASAGVFITYAAHIAAMAPGTNIGAAHPVTMGQKADSTLLEKVTNDAVAYLRSLARKRGRNEQWAEEAVRKSVSLPAEEAAAKGVVDLVADDLNDLLRKVHGRTVVLDTGDTVRIRAWPARVHRVKMGLRERILAILANPNVAYILLILGFYGLFFELSHPGSVLPGVAGLISLILAFYAFQTLPVNYAGLLLILLAMILFLAEVKVQSHGLLGLGGAVSLILGSLMLFDRSVDFLRISWWTLGLVLGATLLFFLVILAKAVAAQRRRPVSGAEGLMGLTGEVARPIRPPREGMVLVHGELWRARSRRPVEKGRQVRVVRVEGLVLWVEPAEDNQSTSDAGSH